MPTLIASVIKPVREILADELSPHFDDSEIEMIVKTMIRLNKLPCYTLSPDQKAIIPDIGEGSKEIRLLSLHAVKHLLLPQPSLPNAKTKLREIEIEIYNLENYS
jgi:hypothetical protein